MYCLTSLYIYASFRWQDSRDLLMPPALYMTDLQSLIECGDGNEFFNEP